VISNPIRKLVLVVGDWLGLYAALFLLMVVRYGDLWSIQWQIHLRPFSLIFPLWLIVFYGSYLYETRFFRVNLDTLRTIATAIAISVIVSISAFYLFPPGLIYPRRNMVLFAAIYGLVVILWRSLFYQLLKGGIRTNILFIGSSPEIKELTEHFEAHPHLKYQNKGVIEAKPQNINLIKEKIKSEDIRLLVIKTPEASAEFTQILFPLLTSGLTAIELEEFYERIFHRVSPEMLNDLWFIRNLENINLEVYELIKRLADVAVALVGLVFTLILFPLVALMIKLDSPGPVIFKQQRVGRNNRVFEIYKFRTMRVLNPDGSAETAGAQWATSGDERITRVGRWLRKTRIDELPQLWNVLRGEMSFVGPRPERPEFVALLSQKLPYYNMRHLIKPGLTGWAQINFEYGDSVEDARTKLQYDIYYAKKRSLILDLAIILKTIKIVITRQGQ